ncbi:Receptor activity-modifying protein 1 [Heterocephalus glaber]|uniref:Receptor activity-modifying protein 1 n=1 Tax=Heterocephalus glaber TaxID=10181 RepID=G5BHG9_HETGA|nr:Receptor activity-modifying protein 1 [Heterocephalus glaber]
MGCAAWAWCTGAEPKALLPTVSTEPVVKGEQPGPGVEMPAPVAIVTVSAHQLSLVTTCQDARYGARLKETCLIRFQQDMEAMGRTLWCDWGKTSGQSWHPPTSKASRAGTGAPQAEEVRGSRSCLMQKGPCVYLRNLGSYRDLTDCTRDMAERLGCFWPNVEVDKFFVAVHQRYFHSCPASGRAVGEPPSTVLCPFVVLPITVTLLVTALVVWRSKRTEGIV